MNSAEFHRERVIIGDAEYHVTVGGQGDPVLLLHGFPQTSLCWEQVAAQLVAEHCIVMPDLRGYGESRAPAGGDHGQGYSKREMANELVELMITFGSDRFAVVGHDRGGRVGYRMALDHPNAVSRLAVLNIVPTLDQFEQMGRGASLGYWPWFLLAQPSPFPERLLSADPAAMLDHIFATWPQDPAAISTAHRAAYRRVLTESVIAAMCADYRASFHIDQLHDAADRAAGLMINSPTLVIIGSEETQLHSAPDIWRTWARDLTAARVPGGHFLPEEAPEEVADLLLPFLAPE